ncbi:MAG: membrane dipeptidase [Anaerolineales bacterium]|jgi:membrane dipeptidase
MIVVDAHEDLAWNALTFGRDYRRSVEETRRNERASDIPSRNGSAMIGWPEWVEGRVGLIFGTLFAAPIRWQEGPWDKLCYTDQEQAHSLYMHQWSYYQRLFAEHPRQFAPVTCKPELGELLKGWNNGEPDQAPVGFVLLMEGADAVRDAQDLHLWHSKGVRILSLSWAGTRYAGGTGEPGPLTADGRNLLREMEALGMILDLSHLSEDGALEALDCYDGEVVITHTAPLELAPNRQKPERLVTAPVIEHIGERDSVLGILLANHFLKDGWTPAMGREAVNLEDIAVSIDSICQSLGSARHVGIGSDFEGGFGLEKVPDGLDSVADIRLIGEALAPRGYSEADIEAILGGNWLRILERSLPESVNA